VLERRERTVTARRTSFSNSGGAGAGRHRREGASPAHLACPVLLLLLLPTAGWAQERQPDRLVVGREAYQMYCLPCHGAKGNGDGPLARALNPPPTNFSTSAYKSMADAELFRLIKGGTGPLHNCSMMTDWQSVFRDDVITSVIAYTRSLVRQ
jgi:mono/diheme cytochrome c family protein